MICKTSIDSEREQKQVGAYFHSEALYWKKIYELPGVYEAIHQERRKRVFSLIDSLGLPPGSSVLEVGCGAGSVAIALAERGHFVQATDFVPAMVSLARRLAEESGVADRVGTSVADVRNLTFPDNTFDLVVAMGVLPWVPPPHDIPVRGIARVLKPGGHLVVNTDNRLRLNHVLDPSIWVRGLLGKALRRVGLRKASQSANAHTCFNGHFDEQLRAAGLKKLQSFTLGFGPFSLLTRRVVPTPAGVKLHSRLQRLADGGFPLLRSCGSQYVVLARKVLP